MSKSGSRYGRRSNWFKIHCLLQEQQQAAVAQLRGKNPSSSPPEGPPSIPLLSPLAFPHANFGNFFRPDNPSSPSISSPDSDSSENGIYSPRVNGSNPFVNKDFYLPVPLHSMFMQSPSITSPFLLPFPFSVTPPKHGQPERLLSPEQVQKSPDLDEEQHKTSRPVSRCSPLNNNDYSSKNKNSNSENESIIKCNKDNENNDIINNNIEDKVTMRSKRFYLDTILGLHSPKSSPRSPTSEVDCSTDRSPRMDCFEEEQDNPIDLSIKKISFGDNEEKMPDKYCCKMSDSDDQEALSKPGTPIEEVKPIPLDLSI